MFDLKKLDLVFFLIFQHLIEHVSLQYILKYKYFITELLKKKLEKSVLEVGTFLDDALKCGVDLKRLRYHLWNCCE